MLIGILPAIVTLALLILGLGLFSRSLLYAPPAAPARRVVRGRPLRSRQWRGCGF